MTNIKRDGKYRHEFVNKDLEGYGHDLFQGAAWTFWRELVAKLLSFSVAGKFVGIQSVSNLCHI
jgi:hypothetical protein